MLYNKSQGTDPWAKSSPLPVFVQPLIQEWFLQFLNNVEKNQKNILCDTWKLHEYLIFRPHK